MPQQVAIVGLLTLKSGVVLDRGVFKNANADAMADTITAITNAGKPLLVIEDAKTFFTIPNLIKMVKDNDPRHALIAEALNANGQFIGGVQAKPPEEEPGVVVKKNFGYTFAEVPQGFSIGANMSLGPTKIKRKIKSALGDGTTFYMTPAEYQRVFASASKFWANVPGAAQSILCQSSDGQKTAYFSVDMVTIGGNILRRYEMEQVAKYRGWAFPGYALAA
jgi:hypothetical protein